MCAQWMQRSCAGSGRRVSRAALAGTLATVLGGIAAATSGKTYLAFRTESTKVPDVMTVLPDGSDLKPLAHKATWESEHYPTWSPDGRWVALTCGNDKGQCNLHLIDTSKGESFELTDLWSNDLQPAWSPDGSTLAFASDRSGSFEIWTVRVGSKQLIRLTSLAPRLQLHPSWSPDGRRIVFSSDDDLYLADADGSNPRLWLLGRELRDPTWSPDGSRIAFTFRANSNLPTEVHVRTLDGTAEWSLGLGKEPAWSPDGRRVAFVRYSSATTYDQIFTIGADGSDIQRVTADEGDKRDPAWSVMAFVDPNNYCATTENSVGLGAVIGWKGSPSFSAGNFELLVTDLPPRTHGVFFWSSHATYLPFWNGARCVAAPSQRLAPIQTADPTGLVRLPLDLGRPTSPFTAGETYYFQYFYRDIRGTRLSDALHVEVLQ